MLKIEVGNTNFFYEFQNLSGRFGKVLLEGENFNFRTE